MTFAEFMKDFFLKFGRQIQLGFPGLIVKYDNLKLRADVQLLLSSETIDELGILTVTPYPILSNIPVQCPCFGSFIVRPEYLPGALVWISFSTFDTANALKAMPAPENAGIFNMKNACVAGAIAANVFVPPPSFASESGFLITDVLGTTFMSFAPSLVKIACGANVIIITPAGMESTMPVHAPNLPS